MDVMRNLERRLIECGDPLEPCSVCFTETGYWYEPKDVALCPCCAKKISADKIPNKDKWLQTVKALEDLDRGISLGEIPMQIH